MLCCVIMIKYWCGLFSAQKLQIEMIYLAKSGAIACCTRSLTSKQINKTISRSKRVQLAKTPVFMFSTWFKSSTAVDASARPASVSPEAVLCCWQGRSWGGGSRLIGNTPAVIAEPSSDWFPRPVFGQQTAVSASSKRHQDLFTPLHAATLEPACSVRRPGNQ